MNPATTEFTANQIKRFRIRKRLSQSEFASRIGKTKPVISLIESNKILCSDEIIELICETFGLNCDWIKTRQGKIYIKR